MSKTQTSKPENYPPQWQVNLIRIFYILLIIVLGLLIYMLWPQFDATKDHNYLPKSSVFNISLDLTFDQRTIILVLITGAIGSFIHSAGSFTNYVGEGKLSRT